MGLLGFNYLVNVTPSLYLGVGGYGAVTGSRGGFLVGGFAAGLRPQLTARLAADVGLFVGAGGGGVAPQGSGLMLRPHVGLSHDFERLRLGLGVAKVIFPDGEIDSNQLYLSFEVPITLLYADIGQAGTEVEPSRAAPPEWLPHLGRAHETWSLTGRRYHPGSDARTTFGAPVTDDMTLVGFEFRRLVDGRWFYELALAGAAAGADGYAEVLIGAGYRLASSSSRWVGTATVSAGAGGGGSIDTGGGLLARGMLGAQYHLTPRFFAGIEAGYLDAPNGRYDARVVGLKFGYAAERAVYVDEGTATEGGARLHFTGWQLRASLPTYLDAQRIKPELEDSDVNLLMLKVDRLVTDQWYLTGQAGAAYGGGAGGYAVGLVGAGWQSSYFMGRNRLTAELLVGAGGGGGVDVGEGAVYQPMLGFTHDFTTSLGLQLLVGRVRAFRGELDANIVDLGLVYRLALPNR
jgi:hypothetical protein